MLLLHTSLPYFLRRRLNPDLASWPGSRRDPPVSTLTALSCESTIPHTGFYYVVMEIQIKMQMLILVQQALYCPRHSSQEEPEHLLFYLYLLYNSPYYFVYLYF